MSAILLLVRRRVTVLSTAVIACLALTGCGKGLTAKDLTLDKSLAKQSLTTALDAWKKGETADSLKSRQPAITVADLNWKSGAKLTDYKVLGERDAGVNLIVDVELTLDKGGEQSVRKTEYTVGTSPQIAIIGKGDED